MLSITEKLAQFHSLDITQHILRGIEKEGLRVTPKGYLAQTFHPRALGSKLTHPYITTDYSEALLELITPPLQNPDDLLEWLNDLHAYTYQHIGDELIWTHSMPCNFTAEKDIPIADYGTSNAGRFKTIYRKGLDVRYGKQMQTIAGIHFNTSYSDTFWQQYQRMMNDEHNLRDFKDEQYFHLIRNYLRYNWILAYLFGASPAICTCFMKEPHLELKPFGHGTAYGPYATSLRLSDIGYQNDAQSHLNISYNDLKSYANDLTYAIMTPEEKYKTMGVIKNGDYIQLNDHILQIEAEFYGGIRPKRVHHTNERPSKALQHQGIEYIEVRSLDINPFLSTGISLDDILFLDIFILYCLFSPGPLLSHKHQESIRYNLHRVVLYGRQADITLKKDDETLSLQDWLTQIMQELQPIAQLLDQQNGSIRYQRALAFQAEKINNPELLPSAKIIAGMKENAQSCYIEFAMDLAKKHEAFFKQYPLTAEKTARFDQLATDSLKQQENLEKQNDKPFADYLREYFE